MRQLLMGPLKAPVEKIRVLTGNVGGSFGMKASCYPEYPAILHAARLLGRPVKWTDERGESFLSDSHGRDHDMEQELALDANGQDPGAAHHRLRQYRRLPVQRHRPAAHRQHRPQHHRRVCDPAAGGHRQGDVHQHQPGRPLSRRRPAGGQLLHRAPARHRGARDGHRPGRDPPPQPHPARRHALQDPGRHHLRQRRFPRRPGKSPDRRRLGRLPRAQEGTAPNAASCAAAASASIWRSPARPPRKWAASASSPTAPSRSSPARWTTARAMPRRLPRCWPPASASRSTRSTCCRAIPTNCSPAAAPAGRSR